MSERLVKKYADKLAKLVQKNGLKRLSAPSQKTQELFWRSSEAAGLISPFELSIKIAKIRFWRLMQTEIGWLNGNGVLGLMTVVMIGVVIAAFNDSQVFTGIVGGFFLYVLIKAWSEETIKQFAVNRILKYYLAITVMYALFWYF